MPPKSNDALSARIDSLVETMQRVENILERMEWKFISKEEVTYILQAHEAKSNARHQQLELEVWLIKKVMWTILGTVWAYALNSFLGLFNLIIK